MKKENGRFVILFALHEYKRTRLLVQERFNAPRYICKAYAQTVALFVRAHARKIKVLRIPEVF